MPCAAAGRGGCGGPVARNAPLRPGCGGTLDAVRILVLSDLHADAAALDAVLHDARGAWDELWLLGDLVGIGTEPVTTLERLRELAPAAAVAGNHEWMLAQLHLGRSVSAAPKVLDGLRAHLDTLPADDRAWLLALPAHLVGGPGDGVELVHGQPGPGRRFAYLLGAPDARAAAAQARRSLVFIGHTHVPGAFMQRDAAWRPVPARGAETRIEVPTGTRAFLNPGSVSEARDGGPWPCYLIWDAAARVATVRRLGA